MLDSGLTSLLLTSKPPFWLAPLIIWELIWKGLALWKAAQNHQTNWFLGILLLNTSGILPIVYLKFFQQKKR